MNQTFRDFFCHTFWQRSRFRRGEEFRNSVVQSVGWFSEQVGLKSFRLAGKILRVSEGDPWFLSSP